MLTVKRWEATNGNDLIESPVVFDAVADRFVQTTIGKLFDDLWRRNDELIFDAVEMSDLMEGAERVISMDALSSTYQRLEKKMQIMGKFLNRAGSELKVDGLEISQPFKRNAVTQVAAIFSLSDGQTISVLFHNPDSTPKKLLPGDELVSWKWLLNKSDVTIAVAPEQGKDLDVNRVARRLMQLAEKGSDKFQKRNKAAAERAENIQKLSSELDEKTGILEGKIAELEALKANQAKEPVAKTSKSTDFGDGDKVDLFAEPDTEFREYKGIKPDGVNGGSNSYKYSGTSSVEFFVSDSGEKTVDVSYFSPSGKGIIEEVKTYTESVMKEVVEPMIDRLQAEKAESKELDEKLIERLESESGTVTPEEAKERIAGSEDANTDLINRALSEYGAKLTDGFIEKNGKVLGVKVIIKGKRIRFEEKTGKLISSGPIKESTVSGFVEKYWFWEKMSVDELAVKNMAKSNEVKEDAEDSTPSTDSNFKGATIPSLKEWAFAQNSGSKSNRQSVHTFLSGWFKSITGEEITLDSLSPMEYEQTKQLVSQGLIELPGVESDYGWLDKLKGMIHLFEKLEEGVGVDVVKVAELRSRIDHVARNITDLSAVANESEKAQAIDFLKRSTEKLEYTESKRAKPADLERKSDMLSRANALIQQFEGLPEEDVVVGAEPIETDPVVSLVEKLAEIKALTPEVKSIKVSENFRHITGIFVRNMSDSGGEVESEMKDKAVDVFRKGIAKGRYSEDELTEGLESVLKVMGREKKTFKTLNELRDFRKAHETGDSWEEDTDDGMVHAVYSYGPKNTNEANETPSSSDIEAKIIAMGGKEWSKNELERIYFKADVFSSLLEERGDGGVNLSDRNNKFFYDKNTGLVMRSYKGKKPTIEIDYSANKGNEVVTQDKYQSKIESMKTVPILDYPAAMEALLIEMESDGVLDQYEAELIAIDKLRNEEQKKAVSE